MLGLHSPLEGAGWKAEAGVFVFPTLVITVDLSVGGVLKVDHVAEKTATHGVAFDNVLKADHISEVTSTHGIVADTSPVIISGDGSVRREIQLTQSTAGKTWRLQNYETGASEGAGNFGINLVGSGAALIIDAANRDLKVLTKIYSTDWTAYTPTYTGFSPATPDNWAQCAYFKIGKITLVSFTFQGNSNTTGMTITLPGGETWNSSYESYYACVGWDSGVTTFPIMAMCNGYNDPNYNEIIFCKTGVSPATWTASGDKGAVGLMLYVAA